MSQWYTVLSAVLAVFAAIGIGAATRRANWLTEEADQSLIQLLVRVLFPALILAVTLGNERLLEPGNLIIPPLVGFGTVVGGFAIAALAARFWGDAAGLTLPRQRRTFAFCVGMYNYGYVPIPLAAQLIAIGLFSKDTIAILFVHNLGVEIAFWTVGILLVSGHLGGQWYKRLLNGPSIAIAVAVLFNFTGLYRYLPAFLLQSFRLLGDAAIPLSLVLVGATIADEYARAQITQGLRTIALAAVLRLGLLPVLFLALAYVLPVSIELKQVILLEAAMPSAVFPFVISRHYNGDPPTAIRVVLGTSILSLVTTLLWVSWGMKLLGMV